MLGLGLGLEICFDLDFGLALCLGDVSVTVLVEDLDFEVSRLTGLFFSMCSFT